MCAAARGIYVDEQAGSANGDLTLAENKKRREKNIHHGGGGGVYRSVGCRLNRTPMPRARVGCPRAILTAKFTLYSQLYSCNFLNNTIAFPATRTNPIIATRTSEPARVREARAYQFQRSARPDAFIIISSDRGRTRRRTRSNSTTAMRVSERHSCFRSGCREGSRYNYYEGAEFHTRRPDRERVIFATGKETRLSRDGNYNSDDVTLNARRTSAWATL